MFDLRLFGHFHFGTFLYNAYATYVVEYYICIYCEFYTCTLYIFLNETMRVLFLKNVFVKHECPRQKQRINWLSLV